MIDTLIMKKLLKKKIEELVNRISKIKKRSIYCVAIGFVFAVLTFITNQNSIYVRPNEIERSSYGSERTPYTLNIDVENLAKDMEFQVSVSSQKYTKEEADKKFDEKFDELLVNILKDNVDYENINSKLNFSNDLGDGIKANYAFEPRMIDEFYGKVSTLSEIEMMGEISTLSETSYISDVATLSEVLEIEAATKSNTNKDDFKYYVTYQKVIDGSGNVNNDDFKINEFCTGHIVIQLSTQIKGKEGTYRSEKYLIPIRVVSKLLTPIESFKVAFKKEVEENDKNTIDKKTITLPKIVNDFRINYKNKRDLSFLIMPILGILAAILLEAKEKEEEREKAKRRVRLLELDFAQIISKILLYVSSGMTIRNSMIRLAEQYQKGSKDDKEERVAYEELVTVKNKLASGYSEIGAYEDMAKNINMRTYTRFLNIIIQSIKNGNKDLKNILNMEVQDALYERKQNAKKLGEEAATKLVLPLMMMLSVIMVVIMVPAFMGM